MLELQSACVEFSTEGGPICPIDQVFLTINQGKRHVITGETGNGKSVLLTSILGLSGGSVARHILWNGKELMGLSSKVYNQIRGKGITYIPQDNSNGLNPLMRIGTQIAESFRIHLKLGRAEAHTYVVGALRRLDFQEPGYWVPQYSHQLSDGMKQRALVTMGTTASGQLLLADKLTKGLNEECRDDVINLFDELPRISTKEEISLLCVTHNLYFVEKIVTHIHIMYAGQILESSSYEESFWSPLHPYSQMMINSLPEHGFQYPKGFVPSHEKYDGLGCRFAGKCPKTQAGCFCIKPPVLVAGERRVQYHHVSQSR